MISRWSIFAGLFAHASKDASLGTLYYSVLYSYYCIFLELHIIKRATRACHTYLIHRLYSNVLGCTSALPGTLLDQTLPTSQISNPIQDFASSKGIAIEKRGKDRKETKGRDRQSFYRVHPPLCSALLVIFFLLPLSPVCEQLASLQHLGFYCTSPSAQRQYQLKRKKKKRIIPNNRSNLKRILQFASFLHSSVKRPRQFTISC